MLDVHVKDGREARVEVERQQLKRSQIGLAEQARGLEVRAEVQRAPDVARVQRVVRNLRQAGDERVLYSTGSNG